MNAKSIYRERIVRGSSYKRLFRCCARTVTITAELSINRQRSTRAVAENARSRSFLNSPFARHFVQAGDRFRPRKSFELF